MGIMTTAVEAHHHIILDEVNNMLKIWWDIIDAAPVRVIHYRPCFFPLKDLLLMHRG